jgi:phage tail sheath protein FI
MPFQLSPGVAVVEKDFTSIVPAVATSTGAFAGAFQWGPVMDPVRVASENDLVARFGKPTDANADSFFTAANFLSYTNNLLVVRGDATNAKNAVAQTTGSVSALNLTAAGSSYSSAPTVTLSAPQVDGGIQATATAQIVGGGVTSITLASAGAGYTSVPSVNIVPAAGDTGTGAAATAVLSGAGVNSVSVGSAGSGYTTASVTFSAPQVAGGSTATGTAVLTSRGVASIAVGTAGAGYANPPTITFTGGGGSGATATATVSGGAITAINVTAAGTGYTSAPTVVITPAVGDTITTPATATATLTTAGIASITVTSAGSGYTSAPTVSISGDGVGAAATAVIGTSTITGITITAAGTGYRTAPTVTLVGGGGTGAAIGAVTIATSALQSITITNPGSGYNTPPVVTFTGGGGSGAAAVATVTTGTGLKINNLQDYQSTYENGSALVGEFAAKYPGTLGNSLKVSIADSASFATWEYRNEFDGAPGTSDYASTAGGSNDELHIIVLDEDGAWTGTQNAILEKYAFVSKASDAKKADGSTNYYKNVVNSQSRYLWWMDHPVTATTGAAWGTPAVGATFKSLTASVSRSLVGGEDHLTLTDGQVQNAWAIFADDGQYDISLLPLGKVSAATASFVINNVAEERLDCVVFVSPQNVTSGDVIVGSGSAATDAMIAYRNALPSTSYAVMDSGSKYQYDRYNDKYRWVPLNGDIAGLCARTDYTNDPWFSPGGLNRGQVKNVVKLGLNPTKTDRDELYKNGINPVVTFPGQGTVLFGDKTLLAKPSAFDRINVRRLFIVLEKAIATAAKFQLFEFNDGFTRAQFKNLVEPFLRDVQGRRGVTEFLVKCDESNNTGEVIDRNEFVADIFIKPNRSINFITLNFVAARSSVNFNELGA